MQAVCSHRGEEEMECRQCVDTEERRRWNAGSV